MEEKEGFEMKKFRKNASRMLAFALILIVGAGFSLAVPDEASAAIGASPPAKVQWKGVIVAQKSVKLTWRPAKQADGYKVYLSAKKKGGWKRIKTLKGKNSTAYLCKGLKPGTKYRFAVRAYKMVRVKQWYNKKTHKWTAKKPSWSQRGKSRKVSLPRHGKYSPIKSVKTKGMRYSYKVGFFHQPYSGFSTGIFIKTGNPDMDNFRVYFYLPNGKRAETISTVGVDYQNLPLTAEEKRGNILPDRWTVPGGYVWIQGIENAGEITVKLHEFPKGKTWVDYTYGRCSSITKTLGKITVINSSKGQDAWMNSVIKKTTNSSMTKKQKMRAITSYLYKTTKYWKNFKNKNGATEYLNLIQDQGIPAYVSQEWNSYDSPALLVDFGEKIGYPLHNMYGDYPYGSEKWSRYHWYAKSKSDGEMYAFCRTADTNFYKNIHSRDDVKKMNCLKYKGYYYCH